MTKIDWNAPLEAYHPDGRVVGVTVTGPDRLGHYAATGIPDFKVTYFGDDGKCFKWQIRNRQAKPAISDELIGRMVELVKRMSSFADPLEQHFNSNTAAHRDYTEARVLANDLPKPVDPDFELAREVTSQEGYLSDGKMHALALAAIKRVRAEYE